MILKTLNLTANGATQAVVTDERKGKSLVIITPAANSGDIAFGDSTAASAVGLIIPKGSIVYLPPNSDPMDFYSLKALFYFGANNDKLSIGYTVDGSNT